MAQHTLPESKTVESSKLGDLLRDLNDRKVYLLNVTGPHKVLVNEDVIEYYIVVYYDTLTEGGAE